MIHDDPHAFVFLRQEMEPVYTWGDRISRKDYYDVFYCEKCLTYLRIKVKSTEPSRVNLEWDTVWSKEA